MKYTKTYIFFQKRKEGKLKQEKYVKLRVTQHLKCVRNLCAVPLPMSHIHIPFEPIWPIVPMNNVMHEGPLQNVYAPT